MCDCFHLAFPNWHAASSGTRPGRRLQGPEPATEDSICDEPSQFTESERPRPQGSSPVEEYPETEKYSDSDKECEAQHDPHHKSGTRKKTKKSGLGSMFEKRSTPKMSKLKEVDSPESGLIVKTAKDGCAEGLVYGGGGKDGIFIKEVVPESPASKSLKLKEGDQILSATVYFDNMSYEDAIQILEHAQAYKLKLCLKRKPEITETEPATESHAIPEEDLYTPEMREKGKTKRRGEARISWPKFSSLGKGRKSHFIRSHSSSEADEQRKLELSPTTSDTESPIKTQDALKYKKKHKIKLPGLTKRGRISSSEDQDTDVPTTGQISSSIHQTQESDMLSPECLESPSREMPEVYVTEDLKEQHEQSNQTVTEAPTIQHKVELISIDSTLKTADLTVALADQESPSGIKSPDGKKKKKERSELKMKILGKDKSHKKEAKAKSSPKRLKTLGASFELVDHPETEKSDLIPSFEPHTKPAEEPALDAKVEHDVSDVAVSQKYPQISEANRQKGNKIKDKQGQTFKLPKVSLGEVATEEIRHDPYEKLAKSSDFRAQLPKREDIEIPGMEAASMKTTAKRKKEPKASYTGHNGDLQAETVQLSIDVDSVKEAVSKLPGYKLPKVDTSGMPIPEEITVIDANAQRISVKTPTKVVDTKTKHGANLEKFDVTSYPEISKSRVKPPQFTTGQLTSEDLLTESKVDFKKPEKEHEKMQKQGSKEMKTKTYKREDITIPGKESSQEISNLQVHEADKTQGTGNIKFEYESDKKLKKAKMTVPSFGIAKPDIRIPDIEIDLPKQIISEQKGDAAKGEKTKFLQEVKMSKTEMKKGKGQTEGVVCEVMIPEIDGIEYIDSVDSSPAKKDDGIRHIGVGEKPNADISLQEIRSEVKKAETEDQTVKLLQFGATTPEISVNVPDGDKAISTDGAETKTLEREGKGSKFKMPNLGISMPKVKGPKTDSSPSKKDLTVTLPVAKAEVQLPEAAETDVTLGSVDIYIPMETEKHPETEGEFDRQGGKFKMPKLGIAMPKVKGPEVDFSLSQKNEDVKLAEAKMKTKPSYVELKESSVNVEIRAPEIKVVEKDAEETQSKFKMPTFKIPRFGSTMPNTTAELYDKNLKDTEIPDTQLKSTEGVTVDIPTPNSDIVGSSFDVKTTAAEVEGKGSKFKMPNLGFSKLKVKGPKIDVSLPKKDIGVTLPEGTANVKLPKVDLDETDVSPPGAKKTDVKIPEGEVEEKLQEAHKIAVEVKAPEYEADIKRHGGKFKMPTFGVKMTKSDIDVQLPDIKADVKLPEAELGTDLSLSKKYVDVTPQTEIETKLTEAHKIDVSLGKAEVLIPQEKIKDEIEVHGSTFKLPKFGITMPKVKGPEFNLGLSKKDSNITTLETNTDISLPDVELEATSLKAEIKAPETEVAGKDTKGSSSAFKMPDLSFSMPKIKGPDVNLSMPKKETDITLPATEPEVTHPESSDINISHQGTDILIPGAKEEFKTPEVQVKPLQTDVHFEAQGAKFKMPEFGITLPKIKGPDIDLSFSKKDANVEYPGAKAEAEIQGTPKIAVDMKSTECEAKIDGQGTKFKMPKFGITMPKVKGPDIDLKFSKKDVDVKFPEAKAEVKLPDVELEKPSAEVEIEAPEIKGVTKDTGSSPTKFTMPTFKLHKFGLGTTSVTAEGPDMDKGVKIEGADISIPEPALEVNIEAPSIELNEPSVSMKTTGVEHEGKGSKFKLPSLGISVPQTKGSDTDLRLSKKDVDVTLPKAKAEVKLPDAELEKPSAEVEIEAPEIKVEIKDKKGSPSKFIMPTFKLPKFEVGTTIDKAEVPDIDEGVKLEGADISIPEKVLEVNIEAPGIELKEPSISLKTTGAEHEGKGSKFKLPSLGFSVPQAKGTQIDLSLSKKDVDVTLPKAKAEVKRPDVELEKPSTEVEIEAPEIKVVTKDTDSSPSKFKMPTFKLPKFGVPKTEVHDMDKGVKIDSAQIKIPEEVLEVNIEAPSIELKEPSVSLKTTGAQHEGKGSKFKLPSLGISVPQTKGPDVDLSLSKKDVDVTLPKAKAEVQLPDVELEKLSAEVEIEAPEIKVEIKDKKGSPSKFTMPTFKLPKFGIGSTSVTAEVPDMDKGVKIEGADISIPEQALEVNIEAPSIELKDPSVSLKTTGAEHEGKGSKFKLPSLGISVPQTKGPEADLSLAKKDVDVTLPKAKAEVKLPDVELEKPSAEVETEAPEIKIEIKDKKGSPSKFKMPTFKLPKFGFGTTSASTEVPDMDKGVKIEGADISIPEQVLEGNIEAPSIELKEPSIALKTTGAEHEGKGSKFKLPSLGISVPQTKGPDIDLSLSKKDVEITLPKAKAEVNLPAVEFEKPSAEVEIEAPEIKVVTKDKKGSPSKFTMPTFKLPKFGIGSTSVKAEVPDMDKGVKIEGADISIPEQALEVNIEAPSIELKEPSVSLKTTGVEHEGKGSKFKLPSLGISVPQTKGPDIDLSLSKKDVDVTLPKAKGEVKLPDVELEKPSAEVEIEAPEIKVEIKDKKGSPSKYKMPTLKLPKFGIGSTSVTVEVPDMEKGVKIEGADISIPEEVLEVNIEAPSIELKEPSVSLKTTGAQHEGKGSKFKLPSLGISVPQTKAPDIDLSLSKKDVDVTLPKAKGEVNRPEVEHEKPSAEVEIEAPEIKVVTRDKKGSPSKFTMPTFKLPKFGIGSTSVTAEVPDMDKGVKIEEADISIPEQVLEVNIEAPSIELKEPSVSLKTTGVEHEGKGSKFKLPSLGISVPQTKGPDIDLSLSKKDVDVTLPKAKGDVKLPDVELEKPSAEVEIEAPEIKVVTKDKKGSPSKFTMPTFKLPKFGIGSTSVTAEVPDMDKGVKIEGADISIPEQALEVNIEAPSIELKEPSVSLKTTGVEHEGKGSKFKLPSLGISVPQTKGPDVDLSLSKKDVDVTLPKAKGEVKLPDVELEKPSAEVEIEAPEIKVEIKDKKGSPSKYKMPTFKLPKFGIGSTSVKAEVPDMDKGLKIEGADISIPEQALEVNIEAPSIELKEPSVSLKTTGAEREGKGSKFKLPSLGISVPQTKGPDIDLSLSKKDVDVTLPKAKAEVKLPDVELEKPSAEVEIEAPEIKVEIKDKKGSPSKYKMPTFKLPKFGIGSTSVTAEVPDMDKGVKIEGADISIPEEVLEVNIEAPSIELKEPSVSLKTTGAEHEGKGSKFKLPSLGISVPQTKGPDIDLSLSKKDVDVTLPKAKGDVKLPDVELEKPSAEVEIEAPEIRVVTKDKKGSPSKFTMPTFKLPKFGIGSTSVTAEVPDMDKGLKIEGADISIPEQVLEVNIEAQSIELKEPSVSLKTTGVEHEGKGSKFKLPSLGISVPQTKGPDIDLSLSKKDVDVTLPKAKAEVKLPDVELEKSSAEVEIEAPEIKVEIKDKKGSPSKYKMPTFKLPKFGIGSTSVKAEVPDMDKGVKIEGADISIPEEVLEVNIEAPSIELKEPSVSLKTTGVEHEGKGSKFKLPSLGISVPQTKGPDIDLSLSKKDVDVTLPKAKAEVKLPDVELEKSSAEVEIEAPEIKVEIKDKKGSPSKYKMPTFKLPKFGIGSTSVKAEVPDMDKGVKIEGADISIPEEVLEVNIEAPSIELKEPSVSLKTTGAEHEGKGSKFKLPSLGISVPQTKGPDIDLSLSKKDVDVTLPKAKGDVKLPDVELEKPSAEVEIEGPEIRVVTKDKKGSPSKFTMPTFRLPKFGIGSRSVTAEVPDMDKGVKIEGADISIPEQALEVNIEAPSTELKEPSVSLKTTGVEHERKGSKFKLPSLGISVPQTKGPDIDLNLSKKDVDVTLPKDKAEVKLPDVELEKPSAEVEIEAPEIKVEIKDKKGSPSKFKMPTFKLPKFGISTTSVTSEVPDMDKGVKIEKADINIPEEVLEVNIEAQSIELKDPTISLKTTGTEHEEKGSKFKLPSLGISVPQTKGPDVDLSLSKKDVDVTLPKAKAEVKLPDAELGKPFAEVETETEIHKGNIDVSQAKLKMPTITSHKFAASISTVSVKVTDVDKEIKTDAEPSIDPEGVTVEVKAKGGELEVSGSKFKMPNLGIAMPNVKGPETDLSLSKKDVDVSLPETTAEVKLPHIEGKETEDGISVPEAAKIEVELKSKRPSWTFPKLSFSRTGDNDPDVDVNIETPKADIISTKAEVSLSDAEIKGPSMEQPPAAELDTNLKKRKFSLPRFSFSKSNIKEPELSDELPHAQVSVPEREIKVKHPGMEMKAPEQEAEQGSTFKFPKFGIVQTKAKGPEIDFNASKNNVDTKLLEIKAEVKISEDEVKQCSSETEAKSKDAGGSPLKIKIPPLKMPKFSSASYDVTTEAPEAVKVTDTDGSKLKEDVSASEKDLSVNVKMDDFKGTISDSETPKTDPDCEGHGSPSKFKLPSFKMPKLSFSKPKPEEEILPADTEDKEDQLELEDEPKGEGKSPQKILTSFGEILKTIDVEFDVPKADKVEGNLVVQVQEIDEPTGKKLEAKAKETITMQDTSKSPERTGWFKFPRFGLSSPSEPPNVLEKDEQKDKKSPAGGTEDEEISPTCSVQSSDAFADISSTITSEYVDPSISPPTTVTVKYSDPNVATGLGETHSNIITSTTRTELISVEPNLAEKITILSSGISSSSEDTIRLDSGKIHVITTNIQATPEAQHAKLLTDIEGELAGGFPLKSEADETASWTVEDSKSGNRTVFERHIVKKTSSERSESRETIVITKQITHVLDSSEPISGETASSIQRLRDSVHSEKMRFFDDAEK